MLNLATAEQNEKAIIGAIIEQPHLLTEYEQVNSSYFQFANTRAMFKAIYSLLDERKRIDVINIYLHIKNEIEGASVISECKFLAEQVLKTKEEINVAFQELEENLRKRNETRLFYLVKTINEAT